MITHYLSKDCSSSVCSHTPQTTTKLYALQSQEVCVNNHFLLPFYFINILGSSLLSQFLLWVTKGLWDAYLPPKMAADLFLATVCVLLGSLPILTGAQSNRTVFSPSSTSGNSGERVWEGYLQHRVIFNMILGLRTCHRHFCRANILTLCGRRQHDTAFLCLSKPCEFYHGLRVTAASAGQYFDLVTSLCGLIS